MIDLFACVWVEVKEGTNEKKKKKRKNLSLSSLFSLCVDSEHAREGKLVVDRDFVFVGQGEKQDMTDIFYEHSLVLWVNRLFTTSVFLLLHHLDIGDKYDGDFRLANTIICQIVFISLDWLLRRREKYVGSQYSRWSIGFFRCTTDEWKQRQIIRWSV